MILVERKKVKKIELQTVKILVKGNKNSLYPDSKETIFAFKKGKVKRFIKL